MLLDAKRMLEHEDRCLKNPSVRSCATCAHDVKPERASALDATNGYSPEGGYCQKDAREEKKCIIGCQLWESAT
jgi:hypothetical protein